VSGYPLKLNQEGGVSSLQIEVSANNNTISDISSPSERSALEFLCLIFPEFDVPLIQTQLAENSMDVQKTLESLLPLTVIGHLLQSLSYTNTDTTPEEQLLEHQREEEEREKILQIIEEGLSFRNKISLPRGAEGEATA
jgi:hypothetical protein